MPTSPTVKLPVQLVRQLQAFRRRLRTVKILEAILPGRPGRHPLLCVPVRFRPRLGNTAHAGMDSFHLRLGGIADFHSVVELPVGLAAQDGRTAGAPDRQKGCGSGRPPAGGH